MDESGIEDNERGNNDNVGSDGSRGNKNSTALFDKERDILGDSDSDDGNRSRDIDSNAGSGRSRCRWVDCGEDKKCVGNSEWKNKRDFKEVKKNS